MAAEQTRERNQNHELDGNFIEIGKLICFKSNGKKFSKSTKTNCQIFRGKFENETKVFIRQFDIARLPRGEKTDEEFEWKEKEFQRDMELLRVPERTSHMHENFTRYFCCEKDDNFYYVAIEWCICSVEDLYVPNRKGYDWEGNEIDTESIKKSLGEKELLRQATKGVAFLHALGFVHRNLKPSNFLIAQLSQIEREDGFKYLVNLSDFRMSKDLVKNPTDSGPKGSEGWISPNPPKNDAKDIKTHPSEDVFILGCLFHYVLTKGEKKKHPFDDNNFKQVENIMNRHYKVYQSDWKPETTEIQAVSLVKDMIKYDPEKRPALKTILGRAYFLPDDYYKLYDLQAEIKPGLCVIFNQKTFKKKKANRYGTEKDREVLDDVFTNFGFEVRSRDNLTGQQLKDEIEELASSDFSGYACLVVCILSHGNEGTVCGTDGDEVSIEEAKAKFNYYKCSSLSGKPKIWIIQACQGNQRQEDLENSKLSHKRIKTDFTIQKNLSNSDNVSSQGTQPIHGQNDLQPPDIPRPPVSDVLDIRATVPGFVSYRKPKTGSTLIQSLCKQLRTTFLNEGDEQSNRHLEDLLKMVQKSISKEVCWLPATEVDKENRNTMRNIIEKNIIKIQEEIIERNVKTERIEAENEKLCLKEVTEEDVKKHENKIDLTFKKCFDEETNTFIFFRSCKQTIEWRSTMSNFIRFEKK